MKRASLANWLARAKVPNAVLALRDRGLAPWITVLTYHRAAEPDKESLFDDGVIDVTPPDFERQVAYLSEHYDIIGVDDLVAFRKGGPLPRNPVLITLDDGYIDNHDVVMPILKKYGAKAAFFIATSYIEQRRLFWWDRINYILKRSRKERFTLTYPHTEELSMKNPTDRWLAIRRVLRVVKDHYDLDLDRFIDELQKQTDSELTLAEEKRLADSMLMTWEHVRALRRAGMDVQSHTSTHRVLQTLPEAKLKEELGGSREVLEGVLGEPVRTISYPVGKALSYTPYIRTHVRNAGYDLGFSNGTGVNHRWTFDPYDAKRISIERGVSDAMFSTMMAIPYLAE